MKNSLYPAEWLESAYAVDYSHMYAKGYRGIIFDIDNTLVFHGQAATPQAVALFQALRKTGFQTCLISNNKKERVEPFAQAVGSTFISKAAKPSVKSYIKAMTLMGTDKSNTFFVGDQLFTDVWGANRTGIYSVLVSPLNKREEIQIVFKRILEKPVLFFYKRKRDKKNKR